MTKARLLVRLPVIAAVPAALVMAAGLVTATPAAAAGATIPASFPFNTEAPPTGGLAGVSCLSRSFRVAVGTAAVSGLVQEWNGRRWRVVTSPPDVFGTSVSCPSRTFCMAIGPQTAAVWNGRRWRQLPGVVHRMASMSGVSCTGRAFCIAVGHDESDVANVSARWDGAALAGTVHPGHRVLAVLRAFQGLLRDRT
jgi:hypothetical protein